MLRAFRSNRESHKNVILFTSNLKPGKRWSMIAGSRRANLSASWPDLFRASTSFPKYRRKTWMRGTSPGMTTERPRLFKARAY